MVGIPTRCVPIPAEDAVADEAAEGDAILIAQMIDKRMMKNVRADVGSGAQ